MIQLGPATLKGGKEEKLFSDQLEKEDIVYRFGGIKAYGDEHPSVFLIGRYAVSFKPFSPAITQVLAENKLVPQIWHQSELTWRDLSLRRRFNLHQ